MRGQVLERSALSSEDRGAMFALMDAHFLGVTRELFERDLEDKDYVLLLTEETTGALCGFTTFALMPTAFEGEPLWVLYSGDTIVERDQRRSFALAHNWIGAVRRLREELSIDRLVWLLICSGPRTYRFLPVFFERFFPHFERPTPSGVRRLIDHLAGQRYGRAYDRASGVVRLANPQPLRVQDFPGTTGGVDPHVACFLRHNPGHRVGDELVCLTELSDDNLTRAGWRMVRPARPHGPNQRSASRVSG